MEKKTKKTFDTTRLLVRENSLIHPSKYFFGINISSMTYSSPIVK